MPVKPSVVSISTVASGWAAVGYGSKPYSYLVFHQRDGMWHGAGVLIDRGAAFDGLCAYMPAAVVNDLFATKCPPYRGLHATYASSTLRATFTAALRADPTTRRKLSGSPFHLIHACVSQLDPTWAGGVMVLPDTSITVWFHKTTSSWQPVYFKRQPHGTTLPPRAIILSVARCVSYNAAEYDA